MEIIHRLHQRRPHPQTSHCRFPIRPVAIGHARCVTAVSGTEGGESSKLQLALSPGTCNLMDVWRRQHPVDPEAWVFASAKMTRPLGRDGTWRRLIRPRLQPVGLEWATFQIMRRTHASLSRQAGID